MWVTRPHLADIIRLQPIKTEKGWVLSFLPSVFLMMAQQQLWTAKVIPERWLSLACQNKWFALKARHSCHNFLHRTDKMVAQHTWILIPFNYFFIRISVPWKCIINRQEDKQLYSIKILKFVLLIFLKGLSGYGFVNWILENCNWNII